MATSMQNDPKLSWRENRQLIGGIWWGAVLIWAGLVFIADNLGYLPQIGSADEWSWILLGAGIFALVADLWRAAAPAIVAPTIWDWIGAALLLLLGMSGFMSYAFPWPLIIIIIGLVLVSSSLLRFE